MRCDNKTTTDTFFNGAVTVCQSREGYRFSIDAVLLAAAILPRSGETVLDMGTGCGVVPILLAFRYPKARFIGVELQSSLVRLAEKNVAANHMQDQITILEQDLRAIKQDVVEGPVDWIVSNPPYRPANCGRIPPNAERAAARHEIHLRLKELMQVCRGVLKTGGQIAVIYPAERLVELFGEMRSAGIEPKWLQNIHSRRGDPAKLVLVKGMMRGKPGLKVAPPLVIYGADGQYTPSVARMMAP
ncbi:MAG: tRNA1(Val) (adenine(37)-N6)-methyltransferase [Desulfobacteraceae bacterium]